MSALQESIKVLKFISLAILSISYVYPQAKPANKESIELNREVDTDNTPSLKYIAGYKYLLHEDYEHELPFDTGIEAVLGFIELSGNRLVLRKGYGWDGASGPVFDTKTLMRATAVHDALYRLIRYEKMGEDEFKERCDLEFIRILEEDGSSRVSRYWIHQAVKQFGLKGIKEIGIKKVRSTSERAEGNGILANLVLAFKSSKREARENRPIPSSM